jgi:hypothetical protein
VSKINRLINYEILDEDKAIDLLSYIEFIHMKDHVETWTYVLNSTVLNLSTFTPRSGMKTFYPEGVALTLEHMKDFKSMLTLAVLKIEFPQLEYGPKGEVRLVEYNCFNDTESESLAPNLLQFQQRALSLKMTDINSLFDLWKEKATAL